MIEPLVEISAPILYVLIPHVYGYKYANVQAKSVKSRILLPLEGVYEKFLDDFKGI